MAESRVCIHGHFYQPPRENPWVESVQAEESAAPYHDWNERITAESYRPNTEARILDADGRVAELLNNFAHISFDVGPTLLAWLERNAPEVYRAILSADRESRERYDGHGSALAQAYNHPILPLDRPRDRDTQVRWGIRDFMRRFGRRPEGMWLPETAVCIDTLEALAESGIRFTVLAPHQARRVRPPDGGWRPVTKEGVDPTRPYRQQLPSGREIAIFFYHGGLSREIAFDSVLANGRLLADRLATVGPEGSGEDREAPPLRHVALDGETFGHHHRHGEMALAAALRRLEGRDDVRLTNYTRYLERYPPTWEVEVAERTSWSCPHGVERWRADCGCQTGGRPGWTQAWRAPLRDALDGLRDALAGRYGDAAAALLEDPWAARDGYIDVILDRSVESVDAFLEEYGRGALDAAEQTRALKLLEMQRHALLMYASCGWFFNDLAGIETVQVLRYAGRAAELGEELFGEELEAAFLRRLEKAQSNRPRKGTGREIYEEEVRPSRVGPERLAAHAALEGVVRGRPPERLFVARAEFPRFETDRAAGARLALGRVVLRSDVTRDERAFEIAAIRWPAEDVRAGVRVPESVDAYRATRERLRQAFRLLDPPPAVEVLEEEFPGGLAGLEDVLPDARRALVERLLEDAGEEAEHTLRELYESTRPLLRRLRAMEVPLPPPLEAAAIRGVTAAVVRAFAAEPPDVDAGAGALEEARRLGVSPEMEEVAAAVRAGLERAAERLESGAGGAPCLAALDEGVALARRLPAEVSLRCVQTRFFRALDRGRLPSGSERERVERLGQALSVALVDRPGDAGGEGGEGRERGASDRGPPAAV